MGTAVRTVILDLKRWEQDFEIEASLSCIKTTWIQQ